MTKHKNILPVDLGNGWNATHIWYSSGPIVLVQLSKMEQTCRSRLDIQKSMFIDSLPIELGRTKMDELLSVVTAAKEKAA